MIRNKEDESEHDVNIGSNYKFNTNQKLGKGSFGVIYKGLNLLTNEDVAVKSEHIKIKSPVLENEAKVLQLLQGITGIPKFYEYSDIYKNKYLILELLGPTCEEIKELNNERLSLKCVLMLGLQMLDRLEAIHTKQIIYRDIKPDNFLIGLNKNKNVIYLVDFGLSRKYIDPKTNLHIPFKEGKSLTGTARYVSIFTHLGYEQSRRDDLEALLYVLIYLLRGSLPWQGMKAKNKKEKFEKIKEKKIKYCPDLLCKGIQEEFLKYLTYCINLGFEDKPDYNYLKNLFYNCYIRYEYEVDYQFNWIITSRNDQINSKKSGSQESDEDIN